MKTFISIQSLQACNVICLIGSEIDICVFVVHTRTRAHRHYITNYRDSAIFKTLFPVSGPDVTQKSVRVVINTIIVFISIFNFSELLNFHSQSFPFFESLLSSLLALSFRRLSPTPLFVYVS